MNSNTQVFSQQEQEQFWALMNRPIRTVYTKDDLAEIVAAIESNNGQSPASLTT